MEECHIITFDSLLTITYKYMFHSVKFLDTMTHDIFYFDY